MPDEHEILSRNEVLELLSQKAREGSTSAMIALERALRIGFVRAFVDGLVVGGENGCQFGA